MPKVETPADTPKPEESSAPALEVPPADLETPKPAASTETQDLAPPRAPDTIVEPPTPPEPPAAPSAKPAPEPDPTPDPIEAAKSAGFFEKLTHGLRRSSSKLADGISGVFTKRKLDDDALEELEDLLITSDMGAAVAARVTTAVAKDRFDKDVTDEEIKSALAEEIANVLRPREELVDFSEGPSPRVVLFVGVNGSGKTTTIGKIASKLSGMGANILLAAGDTFRAAAVEQLKVWSERAGAGFLSKHQGADSAGLAYEAVEQAKAEGRDLVLIDTAGRLQNRGELMDELAKVIRAVRKIDHDAPHDVILVLDATVGQNALSQVDAFRHTAGVTGL
ncbi:MAG: signaling recognition particle receptor family protein, partial [Pseudomonadota bacterium]